MADQDLPIEIWCHIFNTITHFQDIIACKRISWRLYNIIKAEKAILKTVGVTWDEKVLTYFTGIESPPRASKDDISQYWISHPPEAQNKSKLGGEHLFLIKSVILGPPKVGKSALRRTVAQGSFSESEPYLGSIMVKEEFAQKKITVHDGVPGKLQVWDTFVLGERYKRRLVKSYFRGASVILLCFAINDRSSLVQLLEETLSQCYEHKEHLTHAQFYLVGLKSDLQHDRAISDEAQLIASELRMKYFEVSCKHYSNGKVNEMLKEISEDASAILTWRRLHEDDEMEKQDKEKFSRTRTSMADLITSRVSKIMIPTVILLSAIAIAKLW